MTTAKSVKKSKFVVVGSGGGGGTIAWMLAKAGHEVTLLEQGPDLRKHLDLPNPAGSSDPAGFNSIVHDEEVFRLKHPDPKRRPRGDYNTFRARDSQDSKPFKNGWTGSSLGGGSVIWGTWSFRALPIDFKLATHYRAEGQFDALAAQGYSIADWPVSYAEFAPYYRIAEALFAVNGDRVAQNASVADSAWYKAFANRDYLNQGADGKRLYGTDADQLWLPSEAYPGRPYPRTPVGQFVFDAMKTAGMKGFTLATAIVSPDSGKYRTGNELQASLASWSEAKAHPLWKLNPADLWSEATRAACNMCGYCGEFLCWAKSGAKSGTQVSTIAELETMQKANPQLGRIITQARVIEVCHDSGSKRATGVRYLDTAHTMDNPTLRQIDAEYVIVSCGTVQSARLLMMSNGSGKDMERRGLGNSSGKLGRNATFHMFGFNLSAVLNKDLQGLMRAEFGPTGNTASFSPYFLQNPSDGMWVKAGTITSTAKKNPTENVVSKVEREIKPLRVGRDLITALDEHARTIEIRCTSDDLPMERNRVDLDPKFVDEYGFPVARITRDFGPNEHLAQLLMQKEFNKIGDPLKKSTVFESYKQGPAIVDLIGDHQMGTCRMGTSPENSVIDANCRVWDAPNVFVVDASFMPSGLGLNPMMTVVANALRVGSWMIQHLDQGHDLSKV